jgi:hypothetical protein
MEDRSLRNNIDATNKINDIRLSLNSEVGSKIVWVLVEGEDDCRVYPKFFEETTARVEFVNGGKGQLTIAMQTLTAETNRVIGIQDADFLHLEKVYPDVNNLFYTDYHDIEMTMLSFNDVCTNLFTEYRLQDRQQNIWQNVLREVSFISYIRWYNEKEQSKIRFEGLNYGDKLTDITEGKIFLKQQELLNELNTRSKNKTKVLTDNDINNFITTHKTTDFLNLCNGHDVTALLSLIIGGKISHNEFCRHLRISFNIQQFSQTKLYSLILNWQTEHGYKVLKLTA